MISFGSSSLWSLGFCTGTAYWGAVYTIVMLVFALPAYISVAWDGRRASVKALPDGTFSERLEWRKQRGLDPAVRDKLGIGLTSLAPVLTTPLLDLLQKWL